MPTPVSRPFPWLRLSFAGIALVGGGAAYVQARALAGELDVTAVTTDAQATAYKRDRDTAYNLRNAAIGATVLGAGLGIWALLSMGDAEPAEAAATLRIQPAGRGFVLTGAF